MPPTTPPSVALTIAGSDSGGGAGIQADLLSFAACGVFGTTAITCLTAQNPDGVSAIEALPAGFVREQCDQVAGFFDVKALKTGMLLNEEIVRAVAAFLADHPKIPAVVDPVMVATSGAVLLQPEAIDAIKSELLPRAALITPNLDEAGVIVGSTPRSLDTMREAAQEMASAFGTAVLLKGGHLDGDEIVDLLQFPDGSRRHFRSSRIGGIDTHGSGCTLSAAIAANLARGAPLADAVSSARDFLRKGMLRPLRFSDRNFIAHFDP